MRNLLGVFYRFIRILETDYAGFALARANKPYAHLGALEELAADPNRNGQPRCCDQALIQCMEEQLARLGDPLLALRIGPGSAWRPTDPGFRARRLGDALIVTGLGEEKRLKLGDRILALNNQPLPDCERRLRHTFKGESPESQDWAMALSRASSLCLEDGTRLRLEAFPKGEEAPVCRLRLTEGGIAVLRLDAFESAPATEALLRLNGEPLSRCRGLVIDLRENAGGSEAAMLPLLPYVCRRPTPLGALLGDRGVYVNYTENNCDLRIGDYRALLPQASQEERALLEEIIGALQENRGRGMVFEPPEPETATVEPIRPHMPVAVLADQHTAEAAERFLLCCRAGGRALIFGRNSRGALDYSRLAAQALDQSFTLVYPTAVSAGERYNGQGLAPDVHIPWGMGHLRGDPDLEAAIAWMGAVDKR